MLIYYQYHLVCAVETCVYINTHISLSFILYVYMFMYKYLSESVVVGIVVTVDDFNVRNVEIK